VAWKRKRIASGDGLFEAALEFDILPRKMAAKRSMEGCGRAAAGRFASRMQTAREPRGGSWLDQPPDQRCERRLVALEAGDHSRQHYLRIHAIKRQWMTGLRREQSEVG
jgi:hypothetical protein